MLQETDEDSRLAAFGAIREIVEKVVVRPRGPYKPVDIEIHGQLAALLRISEQVTETDEMLDEGGIGRLPVPAQSGEALVAGKRNTRSLRNGIGGPKNGDSPILVVAEPALSLRKDQRTKGPNPLGSIFDDEQASGLAEAGSIRFLGLIECVVPKLTAWTGI